MQHDQLGDNDTDAHQPKTSSYSHHERYDVEFSRDPANVYNKPYTIGFVQDPILHIVHFKFVRKSKIETGGRIRLFGIEPSERILRQAMSAKVKVAVPYNFDQNHAAFYQHLVFFARVRLC